MVEQEKAFQIQISAAINLENLANAVQSMFPELAIEKNDYLRMDEEYVKWVRQGRKTTTIRYAKGAVRVPAAGKIALIESKPHDPSFSKQIGFLIIKGLEIKLFSELTDEDAKHDGFGSREDLLDGLQEIYDQEIEDDEPVSIFKFKFEPIEQPASE